jgi:hypothetical protein
MHGRPVADQRFQAEEGASIFVPELSSEATRGAGQGDIKTAEAYGRRIATITVQFLKGKA